MKAFGLPGRHIPSVPRHKTLLSVDPTHGPIAAVSRVGVGEIEVNFVENVAVPSCVEDMQITRTDKYSQAAT